MPIKLLQVTVTEPQAKLITGALLALGALRESRAALLRGDILVGARFAAAMGLVADGAGPCTHDELHALCRLFIHAAPEEFQRVWDQLRSNPKAFDDGSASWPDR